MIYRYLEVDCVGGRDQTGLRSPVSGIGYLPVVEVNLSGAMTGDSACRFVMQPRRCQTVCLTYADASRILLCVGIT